MSDPKPIIVALDFSDTASADAMLTQLDPALCRVKVGKELFTRGGPQWVERIQQRGFEVFLDLKFHDIPNTVAGAVTAAAELGVWMLNVHASGGSAMMRAALAALGQHSRARLIAVTVLTSLGAEDLAEVGFAADPETQVLRLARLAQQSGMDGVVCSARETAPLRAALGADFLLVTPGIRSASDNQHDQKRIETPAQALRAGSNYLVIGRPITQAASPKIKLLQLVAEIQGRN
ncbi:MAG: orotidine-5'-phosphate decarboxylase [Pseudomonadales bacterium]|jgi:orotidine-5'-phosphate decarboxylase|nr:orotidine-5'-phosphate decarboxylase [Pseudomonadales bacterium]